MPKVSVIIPVYGVEKYIERCARSLFAQTLYEIEFIFIDDSSPDKSLEIVKNVLNDYPNRKRQVIFHKMPYNSGLPTVRKLGISLASGDYIAHCDSDDWVDASFYKTLYEYAIENSADIAYCDYFKSDGKKKQRINQKEKDWFFLGPVWNKIVKASVYNNPIKYPTANKGEDGALMMQLSYYSKKRIYVNKALYYYFENPSSICRIMSEEACLKRHYQECANLNLRILFLKDKGIEEENIDCIIAWKFASRKNLLPLVDKKEYLQLWNNTYPEINSKILFCKKLKIKSKLLFVIVKYGMYPVLRKYLNL